jgi:hypothetical protein
MQLQAVNCLPMVEQCCGLCAPIPHFFFGNTNTFLYKGLHIDHHDLRDALIETQALELVSRQPRCIAGLCNRLLHYIALWYWYQC